MRRMTTGMELRLARVAQRVKLNDIAKRMGRSRATLHRYEGLAVVDPQVAADYHRALATLAEDATSPVAA